MKRVGVAVFARACPGVQGAWPQVPSLGPQVDDRLADMEDALETDAEARAARRLLKKTETEAEAARLLLVSRAIRVSENLLYTNARPTAWWFPVVDPSGRWFQALRDSAELALEPMV